MEVVQELIDTLYVISCPGHAESKRLQQALPLSSTYGEKVMQEPKFSFIRSFMYLNCRAAQLSGITCASFVNFEVSHDLSVIGRLRKCLLVSLPLLSLV